MSVDTETSVWWAGVPGFAGASSAASVNSPSTADRPTSAVVRSLATLCTEWTFVRSVPGCSCLPQLETYMRGKTTEHDYMITMFPHPPLNCKNFPSTASPTASFPSPAPFPRHYFPHTKSAQNKFIFRQLCNRQLSLQLVIQLSSSSL